MAHFAKLGIGNIVIKVEKISNDVAITEQDGINFLKDLYKEPNAVWVQTSYNNKFRKKFAGVGDIYDANKDIFIPIKPYPSWVYNEETGYFDAPVPYPNNGEPHSWNEETKSWIKIF